MNYDKTQGSRTREAHCQAEIDLPLLSHGLRNEVGERSEQAEKCPLRLSCRSVACSEASSQCPTQPRQENKADISEEEEENLKGQENQAKPGTCLWTHAAERSDVARGWLSR